MADKNLSIHLATTADPAGVNAVAAGMKEVAQQAQTATLNAQQLGGTASIVGEGMDKATRSTSGFGQAALTASYFVDDMQYGIRGILNNIPGLVMGLGMGTGVAGVVSVLAVGLSVASEKLDLFGEKVDENKEKLRELTKEARDAATEARQQASTAEAQYQGQQKLNEQLRISADRYREIKDNINAAAAARETMVRNILAETDAEAALRLAKIDALEANGTITKQEAERNKLVVMREAEVKKQREEQLEMSNRAADKRREADALDRQAESVGLSARRLRDNSGGLLDADTRKSLQADQNEAIRSLNQSKDKIGGVNEFIAPSGWTPEAWLGQGGDPALLKPNPEYAKEMEKLRESAAKVQQIRRQLDQDRAVQNDPSIGFKDIRALNEQVRKLEEEADKAKREAERLRGEASNISSAQRSDAEIFEMTDQTMNFSTAAKVSEMDAREAAKAKTAADAAARRREQANRALEAQQDRIAATARRGREFAEDVADSDTPGQRRKGGVRTSSKDAGLSDQLASALRELEDGATIKEIDNVSALMLQIARTSVAKDKEIGRKFSELFRQLQDQGQDLAKLERTAKAARE